MDVVDIALQGIGLASTKYFADVALQANTEAFEGENDFSKRAQLMETFLELERQFILLDSDLVSSSKVSHYAESRYCTNFDIFLCSNSM